MLFAAPDLAHRHPQLEAQPVEAAPEPWHQPRPAQEFVDQTWSEARAWAEGLVRNLKAQRVLTAQAAWALQAPRRWAGAAEDALRWVGLVPVWPAIESPQDAQPGQGHALCPTRAIALWVRPAQRALRLLSDAPCRIDEAQFERWARASGHAWLFDPPVSAVFSLEALLRVVADFTKHHGRSAGVAFQAHPALNSALEAALERAGVCVWVRPAPTADLERGSASWCGAWLRGLYVAKNNLPQQGRGGSAAHFARVVGDARLLRLGQCKPGAEASRSALQECSAAWLQYESARQYEEYSASVGQEALGAFLEGFSDPAPAPSGARAGEGEPFDMPPETARALMQSEDGLSPGPEAAPQGTPEQARAEHPAQPGPGAFALEAEPDTGANARPSRTGTQGSPEHDPKKDPTLDATAQDQPQPLFAQLLGPAAGPTQAPAPEPGPQDPQDAARLPEAAPVQQAPACEVLPQPAAQSLPEAPAAPAAQPSRPQAPEPTTAPSGDPISRQMAAWMARGLAGGLVGGLAGAPAGAAPAQHAPTVQDAASTTPAAEPPTARAAPQSAMANAAAVASQLPRAAAPALPEPALRRTDLELADPRELEQVFEQAAQPARHPTSLPTDSPPAGAPCAPQPLRPAQVLPALEPPSPDAQDALRDWFDAKWQGYCQDALRHWFGAEWQGYCQAAGVALPLAPRAFAALRACVSAALGPSTSPWPLARMGALKRAWQALCLQRGAAYEPLDVLYLALLLGAKREARLYRRVQHVSTLAEVRELMDSAK
jgi:hypothetical protein